MSSERMMSTLGFFGGSAARAGADPTKEPASATSASERHEGADVMGVGLGNDTVFPRKNCGLSHPELPRPGVISRAVHCARCNTKSDDWVRWLSLNGKDLRSRTRPGWVRTGARHSAWWTPERQTPPL